MNSTCPAKVSKAAAALFDESRQWYLPEDRFEDLGRFLSSVAKAAHELRAHDDALDFIAGRNDAAYRAGILDGQFPQGAATPSLRKLLKVPLYPYQAEGALFAVRAGRAFIGDEEPASWSMHRRGVCS